MPRFLTSLEVREVSDKSFSGRGLWKLITPLWYHSDYTAVLLKVPAGFKTDFASVPRLPIVWLLCGDVAHPAAALHDYLYTKRFTTRARADAIFKEAAVVTGVPHWRAWLLWAGVRIGGASHWTGH